MDVINNRRSIRKYLDKKVPDEDIELILRAAMQAPSARNQQAGRFIVCKNKEILHELALASPNMSFVGEADFVIVYLYEEEKLTTPQMISQDVSAAIENSLLEACNLKIGSCWCGTYPNLERMEKVRNILKIDLKFIPFAVVAFGYPLEDDAFKFVDRYDKSKVTYIGE